MNYTTFQDAIDHCVDYLGGTPSDVVQRDAKRAAANAYRDIVNAHRWTYLFKHGRVIANPPYTTGTIQYQHTSGSSPRLVTLSGGMWPDWAAAGYIRVGLVDYRCSTLISSTLLQLDDQVNPGADLPAGTVYTLYQDTYELPSDFIGSDQLLYERNFGGMTYVHPREWLFENRYVFAIGIPQIYTIVGDPQYPNRMTIKIAPFPSEQKSIDFVYHRRPRDLVIPLAASGKVTISNGSTAVVGTNTAFTAAMVGSVFRASLTPNAPPTSRVGANPADFECLVTGWTDATHITIDTPAPFAFTSASYTISDYIDLEEGAMMTAYFRGIEKQIAISRVMEDKPSANKLYAEALILAKEADSRSFQGRWAGEHRPFRQRLRDMPIDFSMDS